MLLEEALNKVEKDARDAVVRHYVDKVEGLRLASSLLRTEIHHSFGQSWQLLVHSQAPCRAP